jgi:hypothetical protein
LNAEAIMDPDHLQEISERDQLWASLRPLRPEIERIAAGEWDGSERQLKLVLLIARIVKAEMDFRARDAGEGGS